MKIIFTSIVVIVVSICGFTAFAQPGNTVVFSLQDCLEVSASKNFDIQSSRAQLQTAAADITGAFGSFLPSINASAGFSRRLNEAGGAQVNVPGGYSPPPNSFSLGVNANYVIFNGFSREAHYNRTQKQLTALEASNVQLSNQVKFTIWQQFIAVLRNSQIVKIRQENLELGKRELERVTARFEAGATSITGIYAQEADNGTRELEVIQAENQLNIAKAALLSTMGLSPSQQAEFTDSGISADVTDESIKQFKDEIGSIDAIIKNALLKRSDMTAADARIEAAESSVTTSRSGYYPSLSAFGGWSWSNYEFSNFDAYGRSFIGLNLSVPIFDNFSTNTQIESATFQLKQTQIEKMKVEQTIRTQAQTAILNLSAAEKQLDVTKRSIKSAEQNMISARERFNVGTAQITDYLLANNQFVTATINRINAITAYREAQAQIRFVAGTL